MSKTSATVKNRYASKVYDRLAIIVPKGRKRDVEATAAQRGESVNGLVNGLLQGACGMTDEEWKRAENSSESREAGE